MQPPICWIADWLTVHAPVSSRAFIGREASLTRYLATEVNAVPWAGFAAAFFQTPRCVLPSALLSESAAFCSREEEGRKKHPTEMLRGNLGSRVAHCWRCLWAGGRNCEGENSVPLTYILHTLSVGEPLRVLRTSMIQQDDGPCRVPAVLATHVVGTMHSPDLRGESESRQARRERLALDDSPLPLPLPHPLSLPHPYPPRPPQVERSRMG